MCASGQRAACEVAVPLACTADCVAAGSRTLLPSGQQHCWPASPAAVVVETLYFYALAHQADFDVCWARGSGPHLKCWVCLGNWVDAPRLLSASCGRPCGSVAMSVVERLMGTSDTSPPLGSERAHL